jgi:hypothetical protein
VEELLGRAGGEIAALRGEYEKSGKVDPWTGEWVKDGKVTSPVATLDAAGRPVPDGAKDEDGKGIVATHAKNAKGEVVPVGVVKVDAAGVRK